MRAILDRLGNWSGKHADKKRIVEDMAQSLFIQGISILLIFAGNLLMARWSGAEAYAKYVHVFNWVSILSIMAVCGKEDIAIARIPRYQAEGQGGRILSFVRNSNGFILFSSAAVIALFLLIIYTFPVRTLHEYRGEFLLAAAAIYFMAFLVLNQNILQSLHLIRLSQLVEKWIKPSLLILFFIIVRWGFYRSDGSALIILAVTVMAICCIVLAWIVWKKVKIFGADVRTYPQEKLYGKMAYFFSIDLLNLLSTKVTMLVLPFFSLEKEIGIFNVSYRFADLVIYPFFLMNTVVPQQFSKYHNADASHKQLLYASSTRLMTLIAIPLLLVNVLAGKLFLGWFGKDFLEGYPVLVQLSIAQFLFSLFGPAHSILTMLDKEKYAVLAIFVYVILLFAGNILLVPVLGITGGTLSVIIGSLVYNGILAFFAWRYCGVLSPFIAPLLRPFRRVS